MYIMCVCLFSALSRRVGALQMSIIIIIIIIYYYLLLLLLFTIVLFSFARGLEVKKEIFPAGTDGRFLRQVCMQPECR